MNSLKAFVYPGQGSQFSGMGKFLYDEFQIARDTFCEANEVLNFDLKKLCFTGSDQELAQTEVTQPALLTLSVATSRVLEKVLGIEANFTAGHSIGEYSSFVHGSVIKFADALKAVQLRGQAMQSAVPKGQGGMMAILGLTENQINFLCAWACEQSGFSPLSAANFNCDGQIVISGNQKTLDWLKDNFKAEILPGETKKVRLIPLQVSAPFHCELMKPAQEKMAAFFSTLTFSDSALPIVQNVFAAAETSSEKLKSNLLNQVTAPVRWTQTMNALKNQNVSYIIECGPGTVLKGLFKKSDSDFFKVYSTNSLEDFKAIEASLIV